MAIKQLVAVVVLSEMKHLPLVILTLQVVSNRLLMTPIFFQTEPHSVHSARFAHPTRFNFYLRDIQTRFCCDEILRGGERRCRDCKEVVDVSEFEHPYLIRCKKCANERLAQPQKCEICSIEVIKSCASTGLLDTTFTTMISEASCHLH